MSNKEMSELSKPVAWQYRYSSLGIVGEWKTVQDELLCNMRPEYERRPIFTAPPAVPDYKLNSPAIPDGWIACSERMPDNDEKKPIAIYNGKYMGQGMFIASYDEYGFSDYWEGSEIIGVTHWMPLPAAPESTASHGLHQEQPSP